ncbi:NAD+ kinase [Leptospira sp. GIMC2001]|uniref:NAD+ kinase n=1 Tax=Leptospira sp. GIMC2001 TaxID=1513297 RepID=UPI00234967E8|nr:NAD+ kinase [Leptospira sp. GIMC2001]WCL47717.1 NAD+ kinase [Leptospira sp. GIMC2001]
MSKADFFLSKDSKVLVVQKKSKFELDLESYGSLDEYKRICELQNNVFERIYDSHIRQEESRVFLRTQVFPNALYIFREELNSLRLSDFDLIVSLGGDNYFTYVAHQSISTPILGCNSDPDTSVGALLSFSVNQLKQAVQEDWKNVVVEEWDLIYTTLHYPSGDVVETFPTISEISIRNNSPDLISRYIVEFQNYSEEQKSSGLLVYTGAGSTGWIASCFPRKSGPFRKDSGYFQVYAREPRRKDKTREHFQLIDFRVKDQFEVVSEMNGGISIDSLTERNYNFPPGARAVFRLGDKKLKVVVQKK